MSWAVRRRLPRHRTNWFQVLTDLQRADYPHARVANIVDVPVATLRGWKQGSEPPHCDGLRLLELWADVTGKPIRDRPMTFD